MKTRYLGDDFGVDLGSTQARVYAQRAQVLWQEPHVVALSINNQRDVLLGAEALRVLGLPTSDSSAWVNIRPVKDGFLADLPFAQFVASELLSRAAHGVGVYSSSKRAVAPRLVGASGSGHGHTGSVGSVAFAVTLDHKVSGYEVPHELSELSRAAAHWSSPVYLVDKVLASALGAGIPIMQAGGWLVLDLGGGCSNMAILNAGEVVLQRTVRAAGNMFDVCIARHLRQKHGVFVSEHTAEQIKKAIGAAMIFDKHENRSVVVQGIDLVSGLVVSLQVDSIDVVEAISEPVHKIVQNVRRMLERTPSLLLFDLMQRGCVLTGGSSQLLHFDKLLHRATGLPVQIAKVPQNATVQGAAWALKYASLLQERRSMLAL